MSIPRILGRLFLLSMLTSASLVQAEDIYQPMTDQTKCTPLAGCRCMPKLLRQGVACLIDTLSLLQRPGAPASLDATVNFKNLQRDGLINPKLSFEQLKQLNVIEPAVILKGQP